MSKISPIPFPNYQILKNVVTFIVFCTFILIGQSVQSQEVMETTVSSEMKRLREDLLKNYDEAAVKNKSSAVTVKLFFDVKHIVNLDEKFQILTVKGDLIMEWKDVQLKWDPSSYSSISSIRIKPDDIWTPSISSLYNVKASQVLNKDAYSSAALLQSNGTVKWTPDVTFDIPCTTRLRHYPFDAHNCSIMLFGWAMADQVILEISRQPLPTPLPGAKWIVTKVEHESVDPKDFYNSHLILVKVFLQRTSRIFRYVCVVPTIITLFTSLFGFWLLPSDTSRFMIGCSNVILMSLCLQNLAATVPAGKDIPLIAAYNAAFLCMSGIFLLVTSITDLLKESSGRPPQVFLRFVRRHLERYLFVNFLFANSSDRILKDVNSPLDGDTAISPEEEKIKKDWEYISVVLDRISFYAFVVTYGVLLAVLASV
ncbi:hypothetical protein JTE90_002472 [Oedothorax gibbosus]|uniref:Neurotransmitter-gated ion-channel ligand-binding domain-containing protein n=1 Tax=Oedothorax gibbosus TaxID=931172 RepID=A0AAV6TXL8_9ARAC|nr:hypothetical protein JTE90_002472 [Oedothorax gibbosus]